MKILIKNADLFQDGEINASQDLLIEDGKIAQIAPKITLPADRVIEAHGKTILPGLVDVHVHFRDPGQTQKETIETGSEASAHGGYTTVCAMPNVTPVPNTPELLKKMVSDNQQKGVIKVEQYAPVTYEEKTEQLVDFAAMKAAGAIGFSNDGFGIQTAKTMYDAMVGIEKTGLPLAAHVEDHALMDGGVMNAGAAADRLGMKGALDVAETSQLARDLELARVTGVHYHVCHVSKARSVELIRRAKADGVNVTAEVSPHHLLLDDSMIKADNPMFKMNPPLRDKNDCKALLEGLLDGTIDMIATDHAPHTDEDKGESFIHSAFGITGIETAFPLLYTRLVKTGKISLVQLIKWMSSNPTSIFKLNDDNQIKIGNLANFAIWDLVNSRQINEAEMRSKGNNTPFIGDTVIAENKMTFCEGKIVFEA
ncbi:dihydroorotase [Fructilactobacillus frigidiflavus]|uniref:dihydroorotase n=1 Tax=Fructilactobacillus frigidiflavus TaxID=3242688 RepID=UPI003757F390